MSASNAEYDRQLKSMADEIYPEQTFSWIDQIRRMGNDYERFCVGKSLALGSGEDEVPDVGVVHLRVNSGVSFSPAFVVASVAWRYLGAPAAHF